MLEPTSIEAAKQQRDSVKRLSIRLSGEVHKALVELAEEEERSLAGEIRYVLKRVVEDPGLLEGR